MATKPLSRTFSLLAFAALAGAGLTVSAAVNGPAPPEPEILAEPCVDGIVPGNPYARNCNLPQRNPRIRGQAPDANAIIACRNIPGCLAYYVNYPGRTVWGPAAP